MKKRAHTRRRPRAWERAKAAFGPGDIANAMQLFEQWASPGPATMWLPVVLTYWLKLTPKQKMSAFDAYAGERPATTPTAQLEESSRPADEPSIFIASDFRDHHIEGYLATEPGNINKPIRFMLVQRKDGEKPDFDPWEAWVMGTQEVEIAEDCQWKSPRDRFRILELRDRPVPRFMFGLNYRYCPEVPDTTELDSTEPCVEPNWAKAGAP